MISASDAQAPEAPAARAPVWWVADPDPLGTATEREDGVTAAVELQRFATRT